MYKIFYKGKEINSRDVTFEWHDHFGNKLHGDVIDLISSKVDDAVAEAEAGEDW